MFERTKIIVTYAWDALGGLLSKPPGVSVESRRAAMFGAAKTGAGVALSAVTGGNAVPAPEGYTPELWLQIRECLSGIESKVDSGSTYVRTKPTVVKYSPTDLVSVVPGNQMADSDARVSKNVIEGFRQGRAKLIELMGGRELPADIFPAGTLDVPRDQEKPKTVTLEVLNRYMPETMLDAGPANVAAAHASRQRQYAAQKELYDKLAAKMEAAGLRPYEADKVYQRILYGDNAPGNVEAFETHISRHVEQPELLDREIRKHKVEKKQEEKKRHHDSRVLSQDSVATLSQIFGGLGFVQEHFSLRLHAPVDASHEETAKAIAAIYKMVTDGSIASTSDAALSLNAREKRQGVPEEKDLFRTMGKSDLYLELKPHVALALINAYDSNRNMLKSGRTFGVLTDSFDTLFEYGRGQAKRVGDRPVEHADRFKAAEPRHNFGIRI